METACGTLRGLGHSMNPTVTTLIGACLLRVVWRYTVFEAVGTVESMYCHTGQLAPDLPDPFDLSGA